MSGLHSTERAALWQEIEAEIASAREVWPGPRRRLLAFVEEAGEVTKAFLDADEEKDLAATMRPHWVRTEIIQTIAMAIRLLEEGDLDFPWSLPQSKGEK